MTENKQDRLELPDLADRQREILRAVIHEFISTAQPVAPWDRETAVARTTLMAAVVREHAAFTDATERERGVIPDARPAVGVSMARGRHREHPGRLPRGPVEESRESHYTV